MTTPEQPSPYPGYQLVATRSTADRIGTAGLLVTVAGACAALAGTVLAWYSVSGLNVHLHDFQEGTSSSAAKALPHVYFGWLLWMLLALTFVAALSAALPRRTGLTLRIIGPLLGALNAVLMLVSLGQLQPDGSIFDHTAVGFWAILIGFIVTGLGGLFGQQRR